MCAERKPEIGFRTFQRFRIGGVVKRENRVPAQRAARSNFVSVPAWRCTFLIVAPPPEWEAQFSARRNQK